MYSYCAEGNLKNLLQGNLEKFWRESLGKFGGKIGKVKINYSLKLNLREVYYEAF